MNNKPLILVVEDDAAVRSLMAVTLDTQGYRYHLARNGAEALIEASTQQPAVMLLDLGLPDMEGVDIIRKVRGWTGMPIIVISARSEDADKVEALDAGADDYLTKPFSVDELLARLRVALRRVNAEASAIGESAIYENGSLRIDYAAGCAYIADAHRIPAVVPAGEEHRQGADPQLHPQGDLGQLYRLGCGFAQGVHGDAAQEAASG